MKQLNVDVAVIGGGTAGLGAYRAAKLSTPSVVMIEGGSYGTTCARVGCMPSKLLIAAAEVVHQIERASRFSIHPAGKTTINGREVMDRVKRERDRFAGFVLEGVDSIPAEDKIQGYARIPYRLMITPASSHNVLLSLPVPALAGLRRGAN
jgi:dihydrolipoamide dehydrogenase